MILPFYEDISMSLVLQGKTSVYSVTHHFRNNLMVPTACFGRIFDFLGRARTNTHQNGYPRPPKNLGIFFHKTDPQSNSKNFLGYATFWSEAPFSPFPLLFNKKWTSFRIQTDRCTFCIPICMCEIFSALKFIPFTTLVPLLALLTFTFCEG